MVAWLLFQSYVPPVTSTIAGVATETGVSTGFSINAEIFAYWAAKLVSIPIWLSLAPEGQTFPFAVMQPVSSVPTFTTGSSYLQTYNFQISIYDTDPDNVDYLTSLVAWQFDFEDISPWTMPCVRTSDPIMRADPSTQERVYVGILQYALTENKIMPSL